MMRQNNQQNGSGPHGHSNAELVSNATASLPPPPAHHLAGNSNPHHTNLAGNSNHHHDIPLATNSAHLSQVPSHNHSAIIQIKDSEII